MKMRYLIVTLFIFLLNIFIIDSTYSQTHVDSLQIFHKRHKHPLPLSIDSIFVGTSLDTFVVHNYGKGIYDSDDGHGGARYFIDPHTRIILKTVIGVDKRIEVAAVTDITYPFDFVKSIKSFPADAISPKLSYSMKTEKKIKLGISEELLRKLIGTPNKIENTKDDKILLYEDSFEEWDQVLFYEATFVFRNNKLLRIDIYNGE
jgi:hypothetical protein